jgi:photosystem II stability/assembly factor-like uncharacterized protein
MRSLPLFLICFAYCAVILVTVNTGDTLSKGDLSTHPSYRENETEGFDGPAMFQEFHRGIRTADNETAPSYKPGFKMQELKRAQLAARQHRLNARAMSNGVLAWTERGPSNVPGRTRGLIVDPDDASKNTWYAGSASGGVWKTTNGGQLWTNITPDLNNLATTVLAMAESNHQIIYLGTGEGFGNVDYVTGNGIFKSTDRGASWSYLNGTVDFGNINRIIVDPSNANIVLAAADFGIYRSTDGGSNWTQVYNSFDIQDLRSTPGNFQVQYATRNGVGVIKSIDGGVTWNLSNNGMSPSGRIEIAISPVNTNRIFASAEGTQSGSESDLFFSDDAGATWSLINVSFNGGVVDFLSGQGWYDNTIACDPFNADIVYFGGAALMRVSLSAGSTDVNFFSLTENANFLDLISATNFNNGTFNASNLANVSIEVRFGPGRSQFAHRFLVPEGATSGVLDANYTFTDYVSVPFEVWDVTNNRQLMVSFRDQDRNTKFNLKEANTDGAAIDQSREYLFIHNITYNDAIPAPTLSVNGGQAISKMYDVWPVLTAGATWDDSNLPTSKLSISRQVIQKKNATTISVADVYGDLDGKNAFNTFGEDVHPDQHNMVMIPVNVSAKTYRILLANDGGLFLSNTSTTPGTTEGSWTMVGNTYNTSQFYGADKCPGKEAYFGGMQDNGTWKSPNNQVANASTNYLYNIGGDGFEVIWHAHDPNKLIGGSQGNQFMRSVDGGATWTSATSGISFANSHPFISKLATSKNNPDVIFTASSAGVYKSNNFGGSWTLKPITQKWATSSYTFVDVEVSRANANIVWAGTGMTGSINLHVSTNGGESFIATNNYTGTTLGRITKLASHPFEPNTAYAIFSFADKPKILRTTDLGQTWNDISGFDGGAESTTGFPDVAVYCLYVRTDDPNILWAGTEIGIVESLDNGTTWALLEDFPNVSVWDMKGQDNQVVIATHGRGIWTATLSEVQAAVKDPVILANGTSPREKLNVRIAVEESFDSIRFLNGSTVVGTLRNVTPGTRVATLSNLTPGSRSIKMISYKGMAPFHTPVYNLNHLDMQAVKDAHITYFSTLNALHIQNLTQQTIAGAPSTARRGLHTPHNYSNNAEYSVQMLTPVRVANADAIVQYRDIALLEPGDASAVFGTADFKDYVVVEGSLNGLDWSPLADGYNARKSTTWLNAYNAGSEGNKSMFEINEVDLLDTYNAGDTVLIRFRVVTNASTVSWGWALDYIAVQQAPTDAEGALADKQTLAAFPNPSPGTFTLTYELSRAADVSYEVVDVFGRPVHRKVLGRKQPGLHEEPVTEPLPLGHYLVVLNTTSGKMITRLIVAR